jgi:adenylate cyclase
MPGMINKRKDSLIALAVFLSILVFVLVFTQEWFFTISPVQQLELKLIDVRFQKRGKIDLGDSAKVVILEIDQESFNQFLPPLNKFPLSRLILAKIIDHLNQLGAKAIGIDILMPTTDQFSLKNDEMFRNAVRKYKNVVLAGKVDEVAEITRDERYYDQTQFRDTSYSKIKYDFGNIYYDVDSSMGIVRVNQDNDNVCRRYLPYIQVKGAQKLIPSFGYALLNKFLDFKKDEVAKREGNYFILGGKKIPQFDRFSTLINFYGPSRTFPTIKLIDILDDAEFKTKDESDYATDLNTFETYLANPDLVKQINGKIILIGSTMPEDRDILAVSIAKGKYEGDNNLYGVELHANAIQNVLSNDFLEKQSRASEIFFIIILSAVAFWGTTYIRKMKTRFGIALEIVSVLLVIGLVYCIYQISILFFIKAKIVTAIVSPSLGVVLAYFGGTAFHFIKERQKNVMIKEMFSQFVSTHIVNSLLSNPEKLKLGGEKKNVTILFSDMAGFTTFSESKTPEELVSFINGLLNELTELIIDNYGTLDKYLGDAVMAFWGAPLEQNFHAYTACLTAVLMQKKVKEISSEWTSKGEKPLHIRIGLNSGDVIVGMVGGEKFKNYTVMGDNVNLASRLEGANKEYQSEIMISESTYEMAKDKIVVRELDSIRVKGKSSPTKVFELIGIVGDEEAEAKLNFLNDYNLALDHYKRRNFEKASELFAKSLQATKDFTSKVYLERCLSYMENPPDENWDGVFVMKTK